MEEKKDMEMQQANLEVETLLDNDNDLNDESRYISAIDDADLANMNFEDAKKYVLELIMLRKKYEKDITDFENRIAVCENNINHEDDEQKVGNLRGELSYLENKKNNLILDRSHLEDKISTLKKKLLAKSRFEPSNNAKVLLDNLEQTIGKSALEIKQEEELEKLSLQEKLKVLKDKMKDK